MILELYIPLVVLSLVLIVLGFVLKEHTELSIIGFLFLFLLSLNLNQGGVDYRVGTNLTASVTYTLSGDIDQITQTLSYKYTPFNDADSHRYGLYLAIASALGFGLTLAMVGYTKWRENYG